MNTPEVIGVAIAASAVLCTGTACAALRSAVRKGCTVTAGVTFKLAPAPQPDTFKADARTFQASLDEALARAAAEAAETARAAAEAAQAAAVTSPPAPSATAALVPAGKAA